MNQTCSKVCHFWKNARKDIGVWKVETRKDVKKENLKIRMGKKEEKRKLSVTSFCPCESELLWLVFEPKLLWLV